jgi:hypothetical protein
MTNKSQYKKREKNKGFRLHKCMQKVVVGSLPQVLVARGMIFAVGEANVTYGEAAHDLETGHP